MNKILFLCVNYNSYGELADYLKSIDIAARNAADLIVEVAVGDNSSENLRPISTNYGHINVKQFLYDKNLGYLGCVNSVINDIGYISVKAYQFVIISNVDLLLSETFFTKLVNMSTKQVGWIAPRIYTLKSGSDENPFLKKRPTKLKLNFLILLYSFPSLYLLYSLLYSLKEKIKISGNGLLKEQKIYAGHGSIMIFTHEFINSISEFTFPSFMYGEEIFFAELVRSSGLNVVFYPSVSVQNIGNVSTVFLNNKYKCQLNKSSLVTLQNIFFKN